MRIWFGDAVYGPCRLACVLASLVNGPDSGSVECVACCGFTVIAALTFFFSFQRKLFFRVFIPREAWREAARSLPKDPDFGRGFRIIAALQFVVAMIIGAVGLWLARG